MTRFKKALNKTIAEFQLSLSEPTPPTGIDELLTALWHDAKKNWERAHQIVQNIESADAAWIHAYLHRKEGDIGNARYWYSRAGRSPSTLSLEKEWEQIARELLQR
jgi:hypothetical protein